MLLLAHANVIVFERALIWVIFQFLSICGKKGIKCLISLPKSFEGDDNSLIVKIFCKPYLKDLLRTPMNKMKQTSIGSDFFKSDKCDNKVASFSFLLLHFFMKH